ncbi:MAG: hypothetical protein AB7V22_00415 [Kiritimatiellia bacterium]
MARGFKTAYGLDVSAGRLVLARCGRRGAPQIVLAAAADSDEARRALPAVAAEAAKGAAALAVAAPAALTAVRRLRAPFASVRKAAKVWPALFDVDLPFPVESAACFYGAPRVENGGTVAVAAALRRSDLAAFLETGRAAGAEPTHCDAEALALWSQFVAEAPPARAAGVRALVWLGADHVAVVRGRGAEFMAAHVLRASPLADDPRAFAALWASRAHQILSAHLAETGAAELDLWWAGPGAEDEARLADLRRALPAEIACRHETHRQPASFLARALARRAADGSGVNFRTGPDAHPAVVRAESRDRQRAYLGVAAAAVLVLALNFGEAAARRGRLAAAQRELAALAQRVAGEAVPRGQETLLVERAISRRDEETKPFRVARDPAGMEARLARVIAEAAALGVEISQLGLSPAAISLRGVAPNQPVVEAFADRLEAGGWSVQSEASGTASDGRPQFILKGMVRHDG